MLRRPTQIHRSTCPVALSAVVWIIFHYDLGLKRPTEDLTETFHYANSKQLPSDVILFIWFTDNNLFTLVTLKNSQPTVRTSCKKRKMEQNAFCFFYATI